MAWKVTKLSIWNFNLAIKKLQNLSFEFGDWNPTSKSKILLQTMLRRNFINGGGIFHFWHVQDKNTLATQRFVQWTNRLYVQSNFLLEYRLYLAIWLGFVVSPPPGYHWDDCFDLKPVHAVQCTLNWHQSLRRFPFPFLFLIFSVRLAGWKLW